MLAEPKQRRLLVDVLAILHAILVKLGITVDLHRSSILVLRVRDLEHNPLGGVSKCSRRIDQFPVERVALVRRIPPEGRDADGERVCCLHVSELDRRLHRNGIPRPVRLVIPVDTQRFNITVGGGKIVR